jgi:hypothetical protein
MDVRIDKPIFIVGVMRSGTTLLYKRMCRHPDLAWLNKTSKKFPRSVLMTRLIYPFHRDRRPTEASWIWSRFAREEDDALDARDVTPEASRFYHGVFAAQLRFFGKPRFLCKYPRNMLRMAYLNAIFPDALFVHIIRDGRAVAHSMYRCRERHGGPAAYWGIRPPGWRDLLAMEPLEACAMQWKLSVRRARQSAAALPPGRYTEVRYEELVSRPVDNLRRVAEACGLQWDQDHLRAVTADIESRNYKWRDAFAPAQVERLHALTGDLLEELGYDV